MGFWRFRVQGSRMCMGVGTSCVKRLSWYTVTEASEAGRFLYFSRVPKSFRKRAFSGQWGCDPLVRKLLWARRHSLEGVLARWGLAKPFNGFVRCLAWGLRVQGLTFRFQGLGFRGLRVLDELGGGGLGFRACGLSRVRYHPMFISYFLHV